MKKKEMEQVLRGVQTHFPGFGVRGNLMLRVPIKHALCGLLLEGSDYSTTGFFANVFLQPLFVPADVIGLSIGFRIGGEAKLWDSKSPTLIHDLDAALTERAKLLIAPVESIGDVAERVESLGQTADVYNQQVLAFARAFSGDELGAREAIVVAKRLLGAATVPWQSKMLARIDVLESLLRNPMDLEALRRHTELATVEALRPSLP